MRMAILCLLLVCSQAYAQGPKPTPAQGSEAEAQAAAVAAAAAAAQAAASLDVGVVLEHNPTTITKAGVGDVSSSSDNQVQLDLDASTRYKRNAPSTMVGAPNSSGSRKCIGGGGSDTTSSVVIPEIWCWKQRDHWAKERAIDLAHLREYEASANAYCSKRMHWRDFGDQDKCRDAWAKKWEAYHAREDAAQEVAAQAGKSKLSPRTRWERLSSTKP